MFVYVWRRLPDKSTHETASCALHAAGQAACLLNARQAGGRRRRAPEQATGSYSAYAVQ